MQIREFSKPVTSKQINESLANKFGYKINLEQFSDVQLEDARNKLRTKISQFEMTESFDSVLESPDYQKTRMFLDCINQEILEREEQVNEEVCDDCGMDPCDCDHSEEHEKDMKTESRRYTSFIGARAKKLSVPDAWINSAIQRIELGESDNEELKAELKTSRQGLSGALAIVSGGEAPTMGAPAGPEAAPMPGAEAVPATAPTE